MNEIRAFRYIPEPYGENWHPSDQSSPHQFDYKFSLAENSEAIVEFETLLREERQTPGSSRLSFSWLSQVGAFKKFTHNVSDKRGFFIQAGCIVTDGLTTGTPRHLLTTVRSEEQVFETGGDRHKPGDSCVFSTVLASFASQDPYGHLPTALFNDVAEYCPWALFSRKLLLPDLHMDSRFLGLGYNFEKPEKKYVILLWHVRTKTTPPTMQISERQAKKHDVPHWMLLADAHQIDLAKKPVDRFALDHLLRSLEGEVSSLQSNETSGFLPRILLNDTWKRSEPQPVVRDEIILDLCRIYQQGFHAFGYRVPKTGDKVAEREFEHHMIEFLRRQSRDDGFQVECVQQPVIGEPSSGKGGARLDLDVRIHDTRNPSGTATNFRYDLELKVVDDPEDDKRHLAQCHEQAARLLNDPNRKVDAIVLVLGIRRPSNVFHVQGAITYPSNAIPIHVVKVVLQPISPSKSVQHSLQVSHAIIPIAFGDSPVKDILLVRRPEKDPTARLPGGKLEPGDTPEQALRRELKEELKIIDNDVLVLRNLLPGSDKSQAGLPLTDESSGQGYVRDYRFYPFLVKLKPEAESQLTAALGQPPFFPKLANILDWKDDGLGQTTAYPRALAPLLSPELLTKFALRIPPDHPASPQLKSGRDRR